MAGLEAHIVREDVMAAQTFLDEMRGQALGELELRGMLASHLAAVREAGYLQGLQVGRLQAAHVVLDALHGEGLLPSTPAPPQAVL